MAERTSVFTIRIEQGQALKDFERLNRALEDNKATRTDLNRAVRENIKQEKALQAELQKEGADTARLNGLLTKNRKERDELNRKQAEAVVVQKNLSGNIRELSNDLSGLTDANLRFRDKMAEATLEAIRQTGILGDLAARSRAIDETFARMGDAIASNEQALKELSDAYARGEKTEQQFRQESERLNTEIEKGRGEQSKLQAELQQTQQQAVKLGARLQQLEEDFRAGRISAEEFRTQTKAINDSIGGLNSRFDAFVNGQAAELRSTLRGVVSDYVGLGAAVYGAVRALGDAADTVLEFDAGLGRIRSLGGEYRNRISDIADVARTAGINFGFSATESIKAVEALAKAGLTVEQILGGGLEGALVLAAGGSIDLANAAETAASALTQFGLGGEDVVRVADALVGGANAAQGGVDELRQALNQSGLVASQFGLSLEDTVGALTTFASAGLLGSDAGTSFRTMLLRLANPSKEARDEMKRLGLELFDSKGEFVGIEATARQFQDRLVGLTDEQRNAALAVIFGQDAVRAANLLYKAGGDEVARYTAEVSKAGTASIVAGEQQDTLSGQIAKANAAWDAFVLSLESGDGVIAKLVRGSLSLLSEALLGLSGEKANKAFGDLEKSSAAFAKTVTANLRALGDQYTTIQTGGAVAEEQLVRLRREVSLVTVAVRQNINDELRLNDQRLALVKKLEAAQETGSKKEIAYAQARLQLFDELVAKERAAAQQEVASLNTIGGKREQLTKQLEEAKAAKSALNVADLEGIAKADALIASIQKEIAALDGKTTATNTARTAVEGLTEAQRIQYEQAREQADNLRSALTNIFAQNPQDTGANAQGGAADFTGLLGGANDIDAQDQALQRETEIFQQKLALWDQERAAYEDLQDAKIEALSAFAGALGSIAEQGSFAAKTLFVVQKAAAAAQVVLDLQRELAGYGAAGAAQAILDPTAPARYAGLSLAAKIRAAASLATIAGTALQGFAEGGEVDQRWGPRVYRANGDNRLVRTAWGGFATLKDGEVVLNDKQQARVRAKTGMDIRTLAELPGRMRQQLRDSMHHVRPAYAGGGQVFSPAPRPDSSTIVQNIMVAGLAELADRPVIASFEEFTDVAARVELRESLASSRPSTYTLSKKRTG